MKKILLIGKLTNIIQTLNESLSEKFHVQICPNSAKVIKDMIKTLRPNLVILSTIGWDEADNEIFELFCSFYQELPVLLVGTGDSRRIFRQYYENRRFLYLESPVTKKQLMTQCCALMDVKDPEPGEKSLVALQKDQESAAAPVKKHILVVDDSPILLRSVKVMLEEAYTVSVSTSGEQALKMIGRKRPDLILLDYEMPGYDGKKTLELLRGNPDTSDIPVIFFTGVTDKEDVMEVLALKPEGYILKPPDRDKMVTEIQEALAKKQDK